MGRARGNLGVRLWGAPQCELTLLDRILHLSLGDTDTEERAMIVAGQTVENPQTGERLVFSETAAETGGEYTQFEAFVAPGGHLPAPHVHPGQSERFEITKGTLSLKIEGRAVEAKAGDVVTIEPGQAHYFANKTADEVSFKVEVRPALKIESVIETMY